MIILDLVKLGFMNEAQSQSLIGQLWVSALDSAIKVIATRSVEPIAIAAPSVEAEPVATAAPSIEEESTRIAAPSIEPIAAKREQPAAATKKTAKPKLKEIPRKKTAKKRPSPR
jgi:hypothetical protein